MAPLFGPPGELSEFRGRYRWIALFVAVVFLGLLARAAQLQVFEGYEYVEKSRHNVERTRDIPTERGVVRDAEGQLLAYNTPAYTAFVTPEFFDVEEDWDTVVRYLNLGPERAAKLREQLVKLRGLKRYQPYPVAENLDDRQLALLMAHHTELDGLSVEETPMRVYPLRQLAAHLVGYLNEISEDEIERQRAEGYRYFPGDKVGRTGLERVWERELRGRRGRVTVIVNAKGVEKGKDPFGATTGRRYEIRPVPGNDLILSFNARLEAIVDQAFRGHPAGAAVVLDARTGFVLAMYSKPSFDPNAFIQGLSTEEQKILQENPFFPQHDKTVMDHYFPGSLLKPFLALAALEQPQMLEPGDVFDPAARFDCQGAYELAGQRFRCTKVHGLVDLHEAIVQSCNVFFFQLARRMGIDRLAQIAREFGFGSKTGIALTREVPGLVPDKAWFRSRPEYGFQYRVGYALLAAIGQHNTKVTLLQLASAYAALANGGYLYRPQLVKEVLYPDGRVRMSFAPELIRRIGMSDDSHRRIIDALRGVVEAPQGTAHDQWTPGLEIAGKTGTAEVSRRRERRRDQRTTEERYRERDHAWFAGFAPADDPEIVVVVLVEHGGYGGRYAAPIAFEIFREYFKRIAPR
ncbi:MAG: penicillin-binding protein 2 [Deltaproteobacteria bacterium]|nr:penicillin-binding protein 2 [Deltaproteobacteria bacterium]